MEYCCTSVINASFSRLSTRMLYVSKNEVSPCEMLFYPVSPQCPVQKRTDRMGIMSVLNALHSPRGAPHLSVFPRFSTSHFGSIQLSPSLSEVPSILMNISDLIRQDPLQIRTSHRCPLPPASKRPPFRIHAPWGPVPLSVHTPPGRRGGCSKSHGRIPTTGKLWPDYAPRTVSSSIPLPEEF